MENPIYKARKFKPFLIPYHEEIASIVEINLGVRTQSMEDALVDVTGDLYFEMRKLTKEVLEKIEDYIEQGKYVGYTNGVPLTTRSKETLKGVKEDLKMDMRKLIDNAWGTIEKKQKEGIKEMSKIIALKKRK